MQRLGDVFGGRRKLFRGAIGLVAIAAPIVFGVGHATPGSAQLQATVPPAPTFEIASIKPTNPQTRVIGMFTYPRGKLVVTQYTLKMLIHDAYSVNDYQISGGARWTDEEPYDIETIPPASSEASKFSPPTPKAPPSTEMLLMLRNLLADRFQLKFHMETKMGPGYALVIASHGPKLEETKNHNAFRVVGSGRTGNSERPAYISGENASMSMLAASLAREFRCPVLDQTELKGDFDFKFEFARDDTQSDSGPSLFTAIQEQLGLKLARIKAPVEILVIDRAEKPSPN
jgi:uncharacterized protein (TIGR03435 family)